MSPSTIPLLFGLCAGTDFPRINLLAATHRPMQSPLRNQRIARKNARRAHAAGKRHAFSPR